jgi:hypothetical protein
MTQPSLTALLQQFQKLNPDAPGQELLEQLVGIVEQLRAQPAEKRAEFPFAFGETIARFTYVPTADFSEGGAPGIAIVTTSPPVRVPGQGWVVGYLRTPEAVMMGHALAEAIAHAGKVRPYKSEPAAQDGEDIPY